MRLRSTGLGKTELEAEIADVRRVNDTVLFLANITKPVKWHARMVFEEQDLRQLCFAVFKPANMGYIIRALLFNKKPLPRTEEF